MAAPTPSSPKSPTKTTTTTTQPSQPESSSKQQPSLKDPIVNNNLKDPPPPTYQTTKTSPNYLTAKSQLSSGEFEAALSTIETTISTTLSTVSNDELHESLAPLYYLYGTTLLYSIEESTNPEEAMLTTTSQDDSPDESGGSTTTTEPTTNELQIAWENLESSRNILSKLVLTNEQTTDLAQIHQRLGDLQRANGNYTEAILDYQTCLEMRMELFGMYHRTVADCHYSLGVAYLMLAADGEKGSVSPSESGGSEGVAKSEEARMKEYREKSVGHYLACGKAFAGLIATLCGEDPETIVGKEEETKLSVVNDTPSGTLQQIRQRVLSLQPKEQQDEEKVLDWKELLDEIQETIDSSEESLKVLLDVAKMKKEAEMEAEAEDLKQGNLDQVVGKSIPKEEEEKKKAPSTTIGFGQTSVGFGSAASTATNSTVQTINTNMVVRKKKKREAQDSKMPANVEAQYGNNGLKEEDGVQRSAKKLKTAE